MSKSILVIDTPSVCIDCPCHFAYDTGAVDCGVNGKELLTDDIETFKPDWCPLKEIPNKKQNAGFGVETRERGLLTDLIIVLTKF